MDSVLAGSFPDSITTNGGNLWRSENCAKNYYTSSYAPKASLLKRKIQREYNFLRFQQPSLKHLLKGIERRSTYQECNRKYVVKAASGPSFEPDSHAYDPKNTLDSVKNFLDAFSMFCTPYAYAIIGSVLSIISASLLAVEKLSDISPLFFTGVLQAVITNLPMVIYSNGLNQLCDVEIDKSFWQGWIVGSWPLIWAHILIFVIMTAYSINVPLLRWKRYPVLAAMCIFVAWAFIHPVAFFFHMQTFVFKRPVVFSRPLIFVTIFMSFYAIAIALFKDIPDIEGDQAFGIRSFSARLGQKRVFWICISFLEMAYGVALLAGATSFYRWSKIVTLLWVEYLLMPLVR